ncbi:MAG: glycosyltransferase family 2 protein [Bryobacterales bacterium]|nr:glycosyltransferase family 2 protein [Bryobacterales bacterium]
MALRPAVSVVVPAHNEEPNLLPLCDRLVAVLESTGRKFEIVIVDDASSDGSVRLLRNLAANEPRLRAICLKRNHGQTAALAAGFEAAEGEVVVAMDGDLQHQPEDIPALLAKIDEGYDLVNGWRENRNDRFLTRRMPSRAANWMIRKLSGVPLQDFGGTFKAYRSELLGQVRLYGDLHRFIPVLAATHGARIAEVPIRIGRRAAGRSHYGLGRTVHVMFDMLTVAFLARYLTRPMHFFGSLGIVCGGIGGAGLAYLLVAKLRGTHIMVEHGPLLIASAVVALTGLQLLCTGLIGEVLTRTYFESQGRPIYGARDVIQSARPPER